MGFSPSSPYRFNAPFQDPLPINSLNFSQLISPALQALYAPLIWLLIPMCPILLILIQLFGLITLYFIFYAYYR